MNTLKNERNFVVKLFFLLFKGLQNWSSVDCKLVVVTALKLNVVARY